MGRWRMDMGRMGDVVQRTPPRASCAALGRGDPPAKKDAGVFWEPNSTELFLARAKKGGAHGVNGRVRGEDVAPSSGARAACPEEASRMESGVGWLGCQSKPGGIGWVLQKSNWARPQTRKPSWAKFPISPLPPPSLLPDQEDTTRRGSRTKSDTPQTFSSTVHEPYPG